jgi:RNA polymerase sigma factor (sigma-70 family)
MNADFQEGDYPTMERTFQPLPVCVSNAMRDLPSEFAELMERVHDGSQDAAWQLLEKYGPHVKRYVRRSLNQEMRSKFDSLDFAQVVWASFFREPDRFRRLESPTALLAYLASLARNKVVGETRRRMKSAKNHLDREIGFGELAEDVEGLEFRCLNPDPTPSAVAIARERWHQLVDNQPESVRRILELRFMGATFPEIAEQLHINERTARKAIERLLGEEVEEVELER